MAPHSEKPAKNHSPIPDIPGQLLDERDPNLQRLRREVANFCGLQNTKFPGSQPVSFSWRDIEKLKKEDYWVCEKSDGVRVLVYLLPNARASHDLYLIDRHNKYRFISGYFFPHYQVKTSPIRACILDGELVVDTDPRLGKDMLRLLVFDSLVIDGENVMSKSLLKRTGRLREHLFEPYNRMISEFPHLAEGAPFQIRLKSMQLSYHLQAVLEHEIPKLMHGNDGLIYTCASSGYVVGTDPRIMKWKPPSENSIDFKLTLRFPPLENSSKPDFTAKPLFILNAWSGGKSNDAYQFFDTLHVDDDEWERMKESGEQVDDRIAEVVWVTNEGEPHWRLLRFRDDKPHGNYIDTVEAICRSIADGVEQEDLLKHSQAIRDSWKERERMAAQHQGQPQTPGAGGSTRPPPLPSKPPSKAPWTGLASSRWSKVNGPAQINGVYR